MGVKHAICKCAPTLTGQKAPDDIAHDVLMRAEEIKANEKKIFGWVAQGETVREITEKGGYF